MFSNHANQMPYFAEIPETYGAVPGAFAAPEKTMAVSRAFIPGQRRRINAVPIVIAVLGPWALFSVLFWVCSFSLHYKDPNLKCSIQALGFLIVVASGISAAGSLNMKAKNDPRREPNWLVFMCIASLMAWLAGSMAGDMIFFTYMQPYYDILNLNSYFDVDPSVLRGQMVMDAGRIVFTKDSRLDIQKSVGFKNQLTYCVAPISVGNTTNSLQTLRSYDFWAVGIDCCSAEGADFHCGHYNNPNAHGGLRLMKNQQRSYFRLAVQQAEAAYGIKAVHPLFFEWMQDPVANVDEYQENGVRSFAMGVCSYFLVQTFAVACAVLAFSKVGQSA